MHYIRLLSPAVVNASNPKAPVLSLKLTITTDLGDTFLTPDEPIELCFQPDKVDNSGSWCALPLLNVANGPAVWKSGMRVLKVDLPFKRDLMSGKVNVRAECRRCAEDRSKGDISLSDTQELIPWRMKELDVNTGLVAPLVIELADGVGSDVAVRSILTGYSPEFLDSMSSIEIEEEIGESIARHIWDAGLLTTALLADACRTKRKDRRIGYYLPLNKPCVNILELGSGVGILGIGLAMILHDAAKAQNIELKQATVLLTDLPEAEERARANISRLGRGIRERRAELLYENLDWEDGTNGTLGPLVTSRFWDYIVLSDCTYNVDSFPVLVGTLSSLHAHNISQASMEQKDAITTKVILSTKPRHDSEKALFALLKEAGWSYCLLKSVPLLKLGGEEEVVEIYSIEKSLINKDGKSAKRKTNEEAGQPAKRSMSSKG